MTFSAMKSAHGNARIVGLDFSLNMLQLAQSKRATQPESATATFVQGSAYGVAASRTPASMVR